LAYCGSDSDSVHSWAANQGDQFFVAIGDGTKEAITGTVSCVAINSRAANTACAGAQNLTVGVNNLNNTNALTDAKTNSYLGDTYQNFLPIYNQLYFQIRPTCTGTVGVTYYSPDLATLVLYHDNTCSAHPVAYATSSGGLDLIPVAVGDVYTFGIGAYYVNYGSVIQVNVTCTPSGTTSQPTSGTTSQPTSVGQTPQPSSAATTSQPTAVGQTLQPSIATTSRPSSASSQQPTQVGQTRQPSVAQPSPTNAPTAGNETSPTVVSDAALVGFGAATLVSILLM
jgi:hypothetical protein